MRAVTQFDARQRTQHRFRVVGADAETQPHMRQLEFQVQRVVAGDDASHQHVAAAAGVLGQRLHHDVGAAAGNLALTAAQVEPVESQARAPGVVQRGGDAAIPADLGQVGQRNELHRHRARRLQPDQFRLGTDALLQVGRIHRVVQLVGDAPVLQLAFGQRLAGPVGVVGNQHFVAGRQQRHVDVGDRRQPAGHQHAVPAAFQRRDPLFEDECGWCPVQAVCVAVLVLPVARPQRRNIREDDGGGLEHARLRRHEARWRPVRMVDQVGRWMAHAAMVALGTATRNITFWRTAVVRSGRRGWSGQGCRLRGTGTARRPSAPRSRARRPACAAPGVRCPPAFPAAAHRDA